MLVSLAYHNFRSTGKWEGYFENEKMKALSNNFIKMHMQAYSKHDDVTKYLKLAKEKPHQVLIVRYEDLKLKPQSTLSLVLKFLGLKHTKKAVDKCLKDNSFEKLTGGRKPGELDPKSFFRKGIIGDWRNHFSEENIKVFKKMAGSSLVDAGYEDSENW